MVGYGVCAVCAFVCVSREIVSDAVQHYVRLQVEATR